MAEEPASMASTTGWITTMKIRHRLLNPSTDVDSVSSGPNSTPKRAIDPTHKIRMAPLVPPLGFAMVAPGVYRSGHPNHCNFAFLDGLQLKSIMYICVDSYRPHTFNWAQDRGLKIFHYRIDSYKQPHNPTNEIEPERSKYISALTKILDIRNLPILIHCNKGKHRVGTISALIRIIQGWDTLAVKNEWDKFLGEGAPPGKNMIWSPGLVFINNHHQHHQHQNQNHQDQNIKNLNLDLPFNTPRNSDTLELNQSVFELDHPLLTTSPPTDNSPSKISSDLTPYSSSSASCWTTPTTQNHKINSKIADGLARLSEWEYVEQFPIDLIPIDPLWIPSWLPIESIDLRHPS
ncbi:hypothetical protein MJO29_016812 [Puccinia striiformis f. sp. tritici]|uniref:Tyrosine specific protein phosphatases domain-containing protein n=1 Tax=Puccinia striiformis TaxID=27350 RepID=A0A2S4VUC1_9BASI|nr:hypothetical protein Pst134EA_017903 [Puccinia striiformis f. sp. tritici]KAH9461606.1 hypothetical protein Pst134EA_017903 [Puccinia striiformis f. sp. tritici]KAI7933578.1 hypothetical protein MJO29_016812 [Puccinia striiformis f. sp. tritici]KAI9615972.1 hypothetical protein H4Q26_011224 [Puccinia striiformis f. sp. tritici PST-130]POW13116.1 hypothetical protein PSHT_07836 [Puccinia striiformis]